MQCNIDGRGRRIRFGIGVALDAAGVVLVLLGVAGIGPGAWMIGVGAALMATGALALFEAAAGWCAARAMGIRLPY